MTDFGNEELAAKLVELRRTRPEPLSNRVCWSHRYYYVDKDGSVFRTGNCGMMVRDIALKHSAMVWRVTAYDAVMLYDFTSKEKPCPKAQQ